MTDAPTPVTPAADPQKSPLDILEELLQKKNSAGSSKQQLGGAPAPVETTPAVDEAAQLAAIQAREQQQLQTDQITLAAKQQELEATKDTPAYQARVQQQQAAEQQAAVEKDAQTGFGIQQLKHIKVEE